MLSAEASTSPWNRTSPSRPASATATALRSFATSIPTNASLISAMVRPPMVRRGSYHSPDHRGAASLIRVAPHRERTYGLTPQQQPGRDPGAPGGRPPRRPALDLGHEAVPRGREGRGRLPGLPAQPRPDRAPPGGEVPPRGGRRPRLRAQGRADRGAD